MICTTHTKSLSLFSLLSSLYLYHWNPKPSTICSFFLHTLFPHFLFTRQPIELKMMMDEVHDVETKASALMASVHHRPGFGSGSGHVHGLSASVPLLGVNWKRRRMPRQRRSSSSFNLLSFPTLPPSSSHVPTPLPARVSPSSSLLFFEFYFSPRYYLLFISFKNKLSL